MAHNKASAQNHIDKGNSLLDQKIYGEAVRAYKKAIACDPGNPIPWMNCGAISMVFIESTLIPTVGSDFRIIIQLFDHSGKLSPQTRSLARLGHDETALTKMERLLAHAEQYLMEATRRERPPGTAHFWLGLLNRNTGRFEKATQLLSKVASARSDDSEMAAENLRNMRQLSWHAINADHPDMSDGGKSTYAWWTRCASDLDKLLSALTEMPLSEQKSKTDGDRGKGQVVNCPCCQGNLLADTLVEGDNRCPHCGDVFRVEME